MSTDKYLSFFEGAHFRELYKNNIKYFNKFNEGKD